MYRLTLNDGWIYNVDQNLFIPKDEQNADYQEYLLWLEQGNQPEPWADVAPAS
jgi:hypothetical protein